MRIRHVLAFAVCLITTVASAGDSWMSYKASNGSYTVSFPGQPKIVKKNLSTAKGNVPAELVIYGSDTEGYCTMFLDGSGMPAMQGREKILLDLAVNSIGAKEGFKLLASESFKSGQYVGRHMVLKRNGFEMQLYAVLKNQYLLMVGYLGQPGTTAGPAAQKFIRSFKVL